MTNHDHLLTLPTAKFADAILSASAQFGYNKELLIRFLKAEYVPPRTVRNILENNFSGVEITFMYGAYVFSAVSVEGFLKKYGTTYESALDSSVLESRTGKNGNVTLKIENK